MIKEIKTCTKCKKEFPATLEYFYSCKDRKSGLISWCKKCHNKQSKKRQDEKSGRDIKNRSKEYYHKYKKNNPKKHKERIRNYSLKTRYNISLEDYNQLLEEQNNVCVICGCEEIEKLNGKTKDLSVDHDHKTGKIRGLLCASCNNILGRAHDNPFILIKCINYLKIKKR